MLNTFVNSVYDQLLESSYIFCIKHSWQLISLTNHALREKKKKSFLSTYIMSLVNDPLFVQSETGRAFSLSFISSYCAPTFSVSKVCSLALSNGLLIPITMKNLFPRGNISKWSANLYSVHLLDYLAHFFQKCKSVMKIYAMPYPMYSSYIWFTLAVPANILL